MKTIRRAFASVILLSGIGLWVCAAGAPAASAAEGPVSEEPQPAACWECVTNSDCDAICGGKDTGYCQWNGCTRCLCTM
ncbi:MAG TPA: hypothetical protein VLS89_02370 [Candidatus Nanopelagicales bacterium]|nr:hypothetical protein [Candidatus Nanopelagicales bacterium]